MKYGFTIPNRGPAAKPEHMAAMVKRGEDLGFHVVVMGDHIVIPGRVEATYPYSEDGKFPSQAGFAGECLEQLTALTFLAGQTSRIRLMPGVMVVPHRSPLHTAKILATIDVLSKGRLVLAVGAECMAEEFQALGIPPFEERGAVTDEYIQAFKELWTKDDPAFEGKYVRFSGIQFLPKPVQKPHPPIWVGGESPRALRRAAELGDGWYPIGSNPQFPIRTLDQLKKALESLARHTERAKRDPKEIEKAYCGFSYNLTRNGGARSGRQLFAGNADQVTGDIRAFEKAGVSTLVLNNLTTNDVSQSMERLEEFAGEVMARVGKG